MKWYTVIGVYPDNGQIFVESTQLKKPEDACAAYPDIEVIGVFPSVRGECVKCALKKEHVEQSVNAHGLMRWD